MLTLSPGRMLQKTTKPGLFCLHKDYLFIFFVVFQMHVLLTYFVFACQYQCYPLELSTRLTVSNCFVFYSDK